MTEGDGRRLVDGRRGSASTVVRVVTACQVAAYVPGSSATVNSASSSGWSTRYSDAGVGERVAGRRQVDRVVPSARGRRARRAAGVAHRDRAPVRARRTAACPVAVGRVDAGDDAEVVEDRVVAAEHRLPRPERVDLERRVVVGVGDHDLGAVVRGRVGQPAAVAGDRQPSSKPGEIHSAGLGPQRVVRGVLVRRPGYRNVMPIGCAS